MIRTSLSLRWRLMILILAPLALISTGIGYWRIWGAIDTANEVFDQTLTALTLAVSKDVSTSGGEVLSETTSELLALTYSDRLYYHVHGPDGVFITGYATPPIMPSGLQVTESIPVFYDSVYRGETVRVAKLMERTTIGNLRGLSAVTVWQPVAARNAIVRRIAERAVIVILSLLATAAAVIWFGINLGLKPLTDLQSAIALRSGDDLGKIRRPVPAEVVGLVQTLNDLFDQVTESMASRDRFVSDAAHQLRNPVAGLLSVAEAAASSADPDEKARRVTEVVTAAKHVSRLANQLLSLERAKTPSDKGKFKDVDLRDVARAVCERNAPSILANGVDFAFDVDPVEVVVSADSFLLSEAIQNLIDNASIHGGPGNTEIKVSFGANGRMGIVQVVDAGPGLSKGDEDVAFSRFGQVRPSHGSGLGLAIVDEISSLHGGNASIQDAAVGACVRIEIPRVESASGA